MKKSLLPLALAVLLPLGSARTVSGQTTSPTPAPAATSTPVPDPTETPTPAFTLPPAELLLTRMTQAAIASGTFHVVVHSTIVVPGLRKVAQKDESDVRYQPFSVHDLMVSHTTYLNVTPHTTTSRHVESVLVGKYAARRRRNRPWRCTVASSDPLATITSSGNSLNGKARVKTANLGSGTVGDILVWHVQVKVKIPGFTVSGHPAVEDFFIAQTNSELVRLLVNETVKMAGHTVRETSTDTYSNYGETVHVSLPAACRGKKALGLSGLPLQIAAPSEVYASFSTTTPMP